MKCCLQISHLRYFAALSVLLTLGCQRAQDTDLSKVALQIPSESAFKASAMAGSLSKTSSLSEPLDVSKLCFAVQVSASDIPYAAKDSCDFRKGIVVGSVAAGENLVIDVPRGNDRLFEVFGYLRKSNTEPCGPVPDVIPASDLQRIYLLGQSATVNVTQPEMVVEIAVKIPTSDQNIAATSASLGASCQLPVTKTPTAPAVAIELKSQNFVARGNLTASQVQVQKSERFIVRSKMSYNSNPALFTGTGLQVKTLEH